MWEETRDIVECFCLLIKWCANSVTSSNEHNNLRVKILRATKAIRETGTEIKSYYKDYIVIKTKICTKIKHYDKTPVWLKRRAFDCICTSYVWWECTLEFWDRKVNIVDLGYRKTENINYYYWSWTGRANIFICVNCRTAVFRIHASTYEACRQYSQGVSFEERWITLPMAANLL